MSHPEPYPVIPTDLLPRDGRFGSGPSKVPADSLRRFGERAGRVLGTSHRQPPVKSLIGRIRFGLSTRVPAAGALQISW